MRPQTSKSVAHLSLPRKVRRFLRWLWACVLASLGCFWWAKRHFRQAGAVINLVFHRVLSIDEWRHTHSQPEIIVDAEAFRALVGYVAREFKPVDILDAVPGTRSDKLQVAFTFDDGWADNFAVVPSATARGIPVTIFVCPSFVGQSMPFWPEKVMYWLRNAESPQPYSEIKSLIETLKALTPEHREERIKSLTDATSLSLPESHVDRTLSWRQIEELNRVGVHFGSHTMTHEILTELPLSAMHDQVRSSRAALEQKLRKSCVAFCYPNANWSAETRQVVREAGYTMAVIGEGRAWTCDCDFLAVPRLNVSQDHLAGPLGGFSRVVFEYTTVWRAWRATKSQSVLSLGKARETAVALPTTS